MGTFAINLVPVECHDSVLKKVINKNFRDFLESDLQPYSYPLSDPEYSGNEILNELATFIFNDESSPIYNKYSFEEIKNFVISCGVTPERIISWLENLFATTRVVKSLRIIFEDEKNHKTKKITSKVKKTYSTYLEIFKADLETNCIEVDENEECADDEVLWAVRSKYGDFPVKFYKTKAINNQEVRYLIRYQYAYDSMCDYYEVREMLYNNWIELDDEHKVKTTF